MVAKILQMLLLGLNLCFERQQPRCYHLVYKTRTRTWQSLLFSLPLLYDGVLIGLFTLAECITRQKTSQHAIKGSIVSWQLYPVATPPGRTPPVSPSAILQTETAKVRFWLAIELRRAG